MSLKSRTKTARLKSEKITMITEPYESFIKNDFIISIKQTDDESREVYLMRVEYIIKHFDPNSQDQFKSDLDHVIKMSYIWRNMTIFNMIYPLSVTKQIF